MEGMSRSETYMLLNEIYARHGKIFKDSTIQSYFESQTWYTPVSSSSSTIVKSFNSIEQANVKTITSYQKEQGYRAGSTTTTTTDTTTTTTPDTGTTTPDNSTTTPDTGTTTPDTGTSTDTSTDTTTTPTNNDTLFPSSTTLITYDDMDGMSRSETYMLINEIYARHGKIFKDSTVQSYFESQIWYTPVSSDSSTIAATFNETEAANVKTIAAFQREQGYRS
jgi:hypothetical protein